MSNLDFHSLSLIFKNLNIQDLVSCSRVCKKWYNVYKMNKPEHLFLIHGVNFPVINLTCPKEPFIPNLSKSLKPYYIYDNSILKPTNNEILKNIETFIFYGNNLLDIPTSFSLHLLPKLKYVEILDMNFCETIQKNFKLSLEGEKSNLEIQYRRFGPSIKTLKVLKIDFELLKLGFPNLENLSALSLTVGLDFFGNEKKYQLLKCKSVDIRFINFFFGMRRPETLLADFILRMCPALESIRVPITCVEDFNRLLSNFKLKHICITIDDEDIVENFIEYGKIIYRYQPRLNEDCILCINETRVKCLNEFKSMLHLIIGTYKTISPGKNHSFDLKNLFLEVTGHLDINILKRSDVTKKIQHISLKLKTHHEINIEEIFTSLTDKVVKLEIESEKFIPTNILDLIPQKFPNLKDLSINIKNNETKKLNFISELKFLNSINLIVLSLDYNELINTLEKLPYLNYIHIHIKEKFNTKAINKIKSIFKKRKLFSTFHFVLLFNYKPYKIYDRETILQD